MARKTKAVLLSAFIFPGLGQIYKGEVRKGVFLIVAASLLLAVFLLGVVIFYSYGYAELLAQLQTPDAITPDHLRHLLLAVLTKPVSLFLAGLLLATWVFSIVDAGRNPVLFSREPHP